MPRHLKSYADGVLKALVQWLRANWLLTSALIFVPFVLSFSGQPLEDRLRWIGGGLQMGGVASVALGLSRTRNLFNAPPPWQPLVDTTSALVTAIRSFRRVATSAVNLSGAASLSVSGELGRGVARPGSSVPVERHLELLWQSIDELEERNAKLSSDLNELGLQLTARIEAEARTQADATSDVQAKLESLSVGGLYLESVGLAYLVFGIALSSFADELALLFRSWPY